jgi:hypothetical protein
MFYVYAYCNVTKPIIHSELGFLPFYIGKGCNSRAGHHLRSALRGKAGKKLSHIRNLITANTPPLIVKIASFESETEAFEKEIQLIKEFGRLDLRTGCLFNNTPGGDGAKLSKELYAAIGNKLRGRKASAETCERISVSLTGRTRTDNERKAISSGLIGVKHSNSRKNNISAGMHNAKHKWQKKWLITTPDTSFCIISLDYLDEAKITSLYGSYRSGVPMTRGPLKGWQLSQIITS